MRVVLLAMLLVVPVTAVAADETSPPVAVIDAHPPRMVTTDSPRVTVLFGFHASNESGFRCRMDARRWRACVSPRTYRLRRGRHIFRVRALGRGGAPGTPDQFGFSIVRRTG